MKTRWVYIMEQLAERGSKDLLTQTYLRLFQKGSNMAGIVRKNERNGKKGTRLHGKGQSCQGMFCCVVICVTVDQLEHLIISKTQLNPLFSLFNKQHQNKLQFSDTTCEDLQCMKASRKAVSGEQRSHKSASKLAKIILQQDDAKTGNSMKNGLEQILEQNYLQKLRIFSKQKDELRTISPEIKIRRQKTKRQEKMQVKDHIFTLQY